MVRHSHQDALDQKTFDRLLQATDDLDDRYSEDCYWILIAGGRLGMRAGEISHMHESWIDWDRQIIEIPMHEPCDCGYCLQQAKQSHRDTGRPVDEIMEERWSPKTPTSARAIPFDFNDHIEAVVEKYWEDRDAYPWCRTSINRRVDRLCEAAGLSSTRVYPHALRATAATWHAYQGLTTVPLQSLMGWSQISTAQKYIRISGGATSKALREVHSD